MLQALQFHGMGAVVTGAAAGLGRATSHALAHLGAHVFAVDVDAPGLARLTQELQSEGCACTPVTVDVTQTAQIQTLARHIQASGVMLKTLVNNVGANLRAPLHELELEDWNKFLALNLTSAFLLTQALLPQLLAAARGGTVVNISSTRGLVGSPSTPSYASTKAGLLGLTRQLAAEYGAQGLRVNAVCPGLVLTERIEARGIGEAEMRLRDRVLEGRFAQPQEVAHAIAFLASDAASYISGVTLPVDGGFSIR